MSIGPDRLRRTTMLHAPKEWKAKRLITFATKIGSGATPRGGKSAYLTSRVSHALIRSQHVFDRHFDSDGIAFISEKQSQALRNAEVQPNDLLLNITGDGVTFARACLVPNDILPACVNQHVSIVRVDSAVCAPGYLLAYLTHPLTKRYIESFNTGGSRRAITKGHIQSFEVPLPPLRLQHRIAEILAAYDELIENCQRRSRILETMARALYHEWFIELHFPGHELVQSVASKRGEIPRTWSVRPFGEIATIHRDGLNPFDSPDEEFEHFSIPAFDDGMQASLELGARILSTKYLIDDGCVLLSKLNPRIPRVWLPQPSGVRRAIASTEFLVLEPLEGFSREFVYSMCSSDAFAGRFGGLAIGTSTSHQRVKPEYLMSLPTAVPDERTIGQFTNLVSPVLSFSRQLRKQKANLTATRDLLLPRLLSGQIDVGR